MDSELRALTESPLEIIYSDSPEFEEDPLPAFPALKPVVPAEARLSPKFVWWRQWRCEPPAFFEQAVPSLASTGRGGGLAPRDNDADMVSVTSDADAGQRARVILRGLAALFQIEVPKQVDVQIDTPPPYALKRFFKSRWN